MSFNEKIILNDGRQMPLLGLGVYKAVGENEVEQAIADAADAGYRLIDTASVYKNEDGVGRGIKALTIPIEELFVTTKIWNTAQRIGDVEDTFNRSLERLGLDYVDLYLIHWPVPGCYTDTWKALEKLQTQGRVKSIGVSNFHIHDLEMLKKVSDVVPAVNQVEFHPLFNQPELLSYCREKQYCGTGLCASCPGRLSAQPASSGNRKKIPEDYRTDRTSLGSPAGNIRHSQVRTQRTHQGKCGNL